MERTIWITRHGERLDSIDPGWRNTAEWPDDPGLSPDGILQARALGARLKTERIKHIFSSPFLRTIQTANEVSKYFNLSIKVERGLSEWMNINWFGETPVLMPLEEKFLMFPQIERDYQSKVIPIFPETWPDVELRAKKLVDALTAEYQGDLLFVGHGASVDTAAWALIGEKPEINSSLCCIIKVTEKQGKWNLEINGLK